MFKTNVSIVDAAIGKENHVSEQTHAPNLSAIKDRQQKTWTSGNYARIGNTLFIMGELLCEAINVHAGDKVLDVATGSGNTVISAARRFCDATGIVYVPELIEDARKRAEVEGMEITFDVGDAEDLLYPDASFDDVLPTLGVMFAPNQEQVAEELRGICRTGEDRAVQLDPGRLYRKHVSHSRQARTSGSGIKPPPLWGTEERLRELLGEGLASLWG